MELPQLTRSQLIACAAIGGVILLTIFVVISGFGLQERPDPPKPVKLEFWGVFDERKVYEQLLEAYSGAYPHVTINYTQKSPLTYETELLNALAAGQGPDIFMVQNRAIPRWQDKITPAPETLWTPQSFDSTFVDVASVDLVRDQSIWAVPFSIDTLALFYNRDAFNDARLVAPPATWEVFTTAVRALTRRDEFGNLTRPGAAIGTANNVNRAADVLTLLMFQLGSSVTDADDGNAVFNQKSQSRTEDAPGAVALERYTVFADSQNPAYTWNNRQHNSIDAFVEGNAAMMLNYSYQLPIIQERAPHLRFAVAPAPQLADREADIALANYWGYTVSKTSVRGEEAWKFLTFASSKAPMAEFLKVNQRPSARRDLLEAQFSDSLIGPFANQVLVAKSYYASDNLLIEKTFDAMIEGVVSQEETIEDAVQKGAEKINSATR